LFANNQALIADTEYHLQGASCTLNIICRKNAFKISTAKKQTMTLKWREHITAKTVTDSKTIEQAKNYVTTWDVRVSCINKNDVQNVSYKGFNRSVK
jgi:hypothetical protein